MQPSERWGSSPDVCTGKKNCKPLVMPTLLGWPLNPCQPWQKLKLNMPVLLSQVRFPEAEEDWQRKVGMWRERYEVHGRGSVVPGNRLKSQPLEKELMTCHPRVLAFFHFPDHGP